MSLLAAHELVRRLRDGRRMLADGAVGSELIRAGIAPDGTVAANLSHPEHVRNIHRQAIAAGAEIITTNTFGAPSSQAWFAGFSAGLALAETAVRESDRDIAVMFSVYPEELLLNSWSVIEPFQEASSREYLLLIETAIDIERAVTAVTTAWRNGVTAIAATCHFQADARMPDGTTPAQAAAALQKAGAMIVGANCGTGPDAMVAVAEQMRTATDLPLLFQPNDGLPVWQGSRWVYPVDTARFAAIAASLFDVGASIVGGCCGTTPAHIAAIDRLLFHPQCRE